MNRAAYHSSTLFALLSSALLAVLFSPQTPASSATNSPVDSTLLPIITNLGAVRRLGPVEAARGYPVRTRGVVTYAEAGWFCCFVQDDTAGIWLELADGETLPSAGTLVDVQGVSAPGSFAPIVKEGRVKALGPAPHPVPRVVTFDDLSTGAFDAQWVELEATVRSVDRAQGSFAVWLASRSHRVVLYVFGFPTNAPAPPLVGARIRVRAVSGTEFNQRGQFVHSHLLTPDPANVVVLRPGASDPFRLPLQPIHDLFRFRPDENDDERARVSGVVTLFTPGQGLVIQDDNDGLLIRSSQGDILQIGDQVEVVGFLARGGYSPRLEDGVYRKIGVGPRPEPRAMPANFILEKDFEKKVFDALLVRISGRLLAHTLEEREEALLLVSEGVEFKASLLRPGKSSSGQLASLRPGSLLEVTGVCAQELDRDHLIDSFKILLDSPGDVRVIEAPSWWTTRRLAGALGGTGFSTLAVIGWMQSLRREVRNQTASLRQSEERYRNLFENANDLIQCVDPAGRFLYVNRAWLQTLGYTPGDLQELTLSNVLDKSSLQHCNEIFHRLITEGGDAAVEAVFIGKNGQRVVVEGKVNCRFVAGKPAATRGIFRDITARKAAEEEFRVLNGQLLLASHEAGMAVIATNVLHNVGNALNSLGVSAHELSRSVNRLNLENLARVAGWLREHQDDWLEFLATDPRAKSLPDYLDALAAYLADPRKEVLEELKVLQKHVEHIHDIVALQQTYARGSRFTELVRVAEVLDDALRANAGGFARHHIDVRRDFSTAPELRLDGHLLMQILLNLLSNAKHALADAIPPRRLTIGLHARENDAVEISVADNGIGIPSEHLARIFQHGFTTRKEGHGFGLHGSVLAAREMGGDLVAHSAGPGLGATFTIKLPRAGPAMNL